MRMYRKKVLAVIFCIALGAGSVACGAPKANLLDEALENFYGASGYRSNFIQTVGFDSQKGINLPSGDSVIRVEYIKEPFQMLFHFELEGGGVYSLISQEKNQIFNYRGEDLRQGVEVKKSAVDGNRALYGFILDLIGEKKENFKEETSQASLEEIVFKGELLPEQANSLYKNLESQYLFSADGIPLDTFYRNYYEPIAFASGPVSAVVTIDKQKDELVKIVIDTTDAMKEWELKTNFLEVNEENLNNTILLHCSLTQEFYDYNDVKSIQMP